MSVFIKKSKEVAQKSKPKVTKFQTNSAIHLIQSMCRYFKIFYVCKIIYCNLKQEVPQKCLLKIGTEFNHT